MRVASERPTAVRLKAKLRLEENGHGNDDIVFFLFGTVAGGGGAGRYCFEGRWGRRRCALGLKSCSQGLRLAVVEGRRPKTKPR